ncbi:MAG: MucR family transcriptional regulator [Alphaproteobacteria bacterium]|nr:MAG: MucR family transcriptional regulator [Alphaproteobacteria bacterium]
MNKKSDFGIKHDEYGSDESDAVVEGTEELATTCNSLESELIIKSTVEVFSAFIRNSGQKIHIDQVKDYLYLIKGHIKSVFKTTGKPLKPAVPIEKSVHRDYIICLNTGKKLRVLRRYLQNTLGMTIEEYKAMWNLPKDYPVVAPSYSEKRRRLAQQTKLGYTRKSKAEPHRRINILGQ